MRISTKMRYSSRALTELARHYTSGPLPLHLIAKAQDLPVKYLEQLMSMLKSGNFVRSIRGAKGGYVLTKSPKQIKMSDVFTCLEGSVTTVQCIQDNPSCERASSCPVRPLWCQVNDAIMDVLENTSLQNLIDKPLPHDEG